MLACLKFSSLSILELLPGSNGTGGLTGRGFRADDRIFRNG
jgi:hypothetical protein